MFQTQSQNDSAPKVGLVLSGGGAKGLAHIGALKTLDSLGVKADYIAGTSMGAIVGSLYASGYTGKQLDSIFQRIDFDELIADELPRASKTFYEKENSEKYALSIPFNNLKIQIPSALSRGQNVFNLLSRLMLHVSDIDDFEILPIPFLCIATNIETGKPVILDSGSLAQAVKASGALPSLFQPVILNDQDHRFGSRHGGKRHGHRLGKGSPRDLRGQGRTSTAALDEEMPRHGHDCRGCHRRGGSSGRP